MTDVEFKEWLINECDVRKIRHFTEKQFAQHQDLIDIIISKTKFLRSTATIAERIYCINHDIKTQKMCPVCGKNPLNFTNRRGGRYYETGCCAKCSKQNPVVKKRTQETCMNRYGVKSHNSSPEIKKKKIEALRNKYGVENVSQLSSVVEKRKQVIKEKFGVECSLMLPKARIARAKTSLEISYNNYILKNDLDEPCFTLEEYLQRQSEDELLEFRCKKCGKTFMTNHHDGVHKPCPYCYRKGKSFIEYEISEYLRENNIKFHRNVRTVISPYELDIYVQEYNFAIEVNGIFWHSLRTKDMKNMELYKTIVCEKKQISLIHIWEDDWKDPVKQEQLKEIILMHLGMKTIKFDSPMIELDRMLFPKTFCPEGYLFVKELSPTVDIRRNKFHCYNCGKLVYSKQNS